MPLTNDDPRTSLPMPNEPLYERLAEHYRRIIRSGTLAPGDRMPSVLAFMKQHQVSLITALQALRRLEDAGWLLAKPRAGYFVRRPVVSKLASVQESEVTALPPDAQFVGLHETISRVIKRSHAFPETWNLGGATADAQLYPTSHLQSLTMRPLRRRPGLLTQAGTPGGAVEFRQVLAKREQSHDIVVSPDEVIVTSDGIDAVNLALRAVAQSGDTIAIESPAFFGLLQVLESLGLCAPEIPTSPTTGISPEVLDVALNAYGTVKALIVVPHLQNPLGSVMPNERKAALVKLCLLRGIAIIEDDPYRELVEPGSTARPIKSWDWDKNIIYCSSLNKVFSPGIRLGWMSSGQWHSRVKMLKFAQSRLNETLPQLVAAEFIRTGDFDRHLHRLRERLHVQRDDTCDVVARYFPRGTRLSPPVGGLLLSIALPEGIASEKLFEAALEQGIRVAPGVVFSNSNRFNSFIRLSCPKPFDRDMEMAIRRLGQLVCTIA